MKKRHQPRYPKLLRWSQEDSAWIAEVPDLPGCAADGETEADAIRAADEAARLWIEVATDQGREIPPPSDPATASGKFIVRVPKTLHHRLQLLAQHEGVSLNQLVVSLLAAQERERHDHG